jgi:hypothetical protein
MTWKIWKKGKSISEKIWKTWKKPKLKVKRYGKYRRKMWNDMENMEEIQVE